MGYPTKVQLISRKKTADQYYINFPRAIAMAMNFSKSDPVEWEIADKDTLILKSIPVLSFHAIPTFAALLCDIAIMLYAKRYV